MLIQGLVMMVIEPVAVFISIMVTDAPGSGVGEQLYGFALIWLPVNGVLWLGLTIFLLVANKKELVEHF